MLLAPSEEERVLVARYWSCHRHSLRGHLNRDLLAQKSLLCAQLALFVLQGVLPVAKCLAKLSISVAEAVLLANFHKLKLVLHCLANHVFEPMNVG